MRYTLIYIAIFSLIQSLRISSDDSGELIFIISNILFSGFVITKLFLIRKEQGYIISPIFLASAKMFLLGYGCTIFYIYLIDVPINYLVKANKPFTLLNNGMIYASLGFITLWHSYHSSIIKRSATHTFNFLTQKKKLLRESLNPKLGIVYLLIFIAIVIKLLFMSLGIYGVLSSDSGTNSITAYMQFYVYLDILGQLSATIMYINYFKTKKNKYITLLILLFQLFFAILSGFKGAIVSIFITLLLSVYLVRNRIKKSYIILTVLSVIFAYNVIEPYRYYIQVNPQFDSKSLSGILEGVTESSKYYRKSLGTFAISAVMRRASYLSELASFQDYKINNGLQENDPDFLFIISTTPLQIFVPRLLWPDKPRSDLGVTFVTQTVLGEKYSSSSAFGPLGFLYLAGDWVAIIIGFILIGFILQTANLFFTSGRWGGIIIYLLLYSSITGLEAQYNFYLIASVQLVLIGLLYQYLILKRSKNKIQSV